MASLRREPRGACLQHVLDRAGRDPQLTGIVAAVERPAAGLCWRGRTGDLDVDSRFFVASTTKLHTTAILLRLIERGDLRLDDRLVDVVGVETVAGVHVRRGIDRTGAVTIEHLMSQTSGIADYFQGRQPDGTSLQESVLSGSDRSWTPADAIDIARSIGAAFPPGPVGVRCIRTRTTNCWAW